uniref:Phosphoenolpyruvate carboxykinase C-terminal P-loop domain-containing protein n=1 Tax=Globodera rostochiensis TaxID=31243 RepID=A0A914H320_GLORO
DWIVRRLEDKPDIGIETAIGTIPTRGSMNLDELGKIDWDELMSLPPDYWHEDAKEVRTFLEEQVGTDLPEAILNELNSQEKRIAAL